MVRDDSDALVRLFGVPEVRADQQSSVFPLRGFCFLALLALAPNNRLTRAQAAEQLWDNDGTPANLRNLRQLLLRMHRASPAFETLVGVDANTVWLSAQRTQIDLCRFLSLTSERDPPVTEILHLYRGDLLQGIDPGTDALRDQLRFSATYCRERYYAMLESGLKESVRYGTADLSVLRAIELHALAIDPLREETYRMLIAAFGAIGRPNEARRLYKALAEALKIDGEVSPVIETKTAMARATAQVIDFAAKRAVPAQAPRLALLAPRWIAGRSPKDNLHRLLVEDIANELARYRSLVALAPHSTFQADDDGGLIDKNDVLRADYAMSSVVRPGEGLGELGVRLVETSSARVVWSGDFSLRQDVLVSSSRRVIAQVAAEISGAIESDTFRRLEKTNNPSSYVMFLRGQNALKTSDLRSVRRARKEYKAAIAEDDRFAEAYSGLSCSLYLEWILLGGTEPRLLADAKELAEAAIARDPASAAGYWRKADVLLYQQDFDGSEECFQKASELHPNSADILLDHSDALGHVGDADEAWRMFERAIELNPTPPDFYWWVGASIGFSQTNYPKVVELCGRLQSDEPVLRLLAAAHGQMGNLSAAREYGLRIKEAYPGQTAEEMTSLQPHRSKQDLQPFIDGLRVSGID